MGNLNCCLFDEDAREAREMHQFYQTRRTRESVDTSGPTAIYGPSDAYSAAMPSRPANLGTIDITADATTRGAIPVRQGVERRCVQPAAPKQRSRPSVPSEGPSLPPQVYVSDADFVSAGGETEEGAFERRKRYEASKRLRHKTISNVAGLI